MGVWTWVRLYHVLPDEGPREGHRLLSITTSEAVDPSCGLVVTRSQGASQERRSPTSLGSCGGISYVKWG